MPPEKSVTTTTPLPHHYGSTTTPLPSQEEEKLSEKEKKRKEDLLPGAETAPDPPAAPVIEIILNNGSHHQVFAADVERWSALYPAVDIVAQLRKMAGWSEANPKKRKTKDGVKRFINSWLAKEQDRSGSAQVDPEGPKNGDRRDGRVYMDGKWVQV